MCQQSVSGLAPHSITIDHRRMGLGFQVIKANECITINIFINWLRFS